MKRLLIAALCVTTLAPAGTAQTVREESERKLQALTANLQEHSAKAKTESTEGQKAVAAGDKVTACMRFKTSRAEAGVVLDLLGQQRDYVLMLAPDAASGVAKTNNIDRMQGAWLALTGQLDERVTAVCVP